jgi:hypothetical protein
MLGLVSEIYFHGGLGAIGAALMHKCALSQKNVITENRIRMLFWKVVYVSRFEFHLWGRDPHFVGIAKSS